MSGFTYFSKDGVEVRRKAPPWRTDQETVLTRIRIQDEDIPEDSAIVYIDDATTLALANALLCSIGRLPVSEQAT